ncbi:MAG: hypothetical protein ACI4C1_10820 [Lachnospiraceae bacterium]
MPQIDYEMIKQKLKDCEILLIGVGSELSEERLEKEKLQELYEKIRQLTRKKFYFVLTTNTDDALYHSTLDGKRIAAPCGSVHRWQCKAACTKEVWEEKPAVCPHCKGEVVENIWTNKPYVEEGYMKQWQAYRSWLSLGMNRKMLLLELGCDFTAPMIIRWPFERLTMINQKSYLIRVGEKFPQISQEIAERACSVPISAENFLKQVLN